jgi:hypothetical protein
VIQNHHIQRKQKKCKIQFEFVLLTSTDLLLLCKQESRQHHHESTTARGTTATCRTIVGKGERGEEKKQNKTQIACSGEKKLILKKMRKRTVREKERQPFLSAVVEVSVARAEKEREAA